MRHTILSAVGASLLAAALIPSAAQAQVLRVVARTRLVSLNERASGSRLAAGTRTSSRVISACQTDRSDT